MNTPVDGLCHLLANELNNRLEGEIVGLVHAGDNIWHYGLRLPDGRILDKHGAHESGEAFLEKANEAWPEANFELVETEISRESVEIFSDEEQEKAKSYAFKIINSLA